MSLVWPCLLLEDSFDLANLLLHLAGDLLGTSFVFELGIVGHAPGLFLHLALDLVHCPANLIPGALFHGFPPSVLMLLHCSPNGRTGKSTRFCLWRPRRIPSSSFDPSEARRYTQDACIYSSRSSALRPLSPCGHACARA